MESLKTKSITKVGAGDGFSVFASDNGIVMTCGDGTLGCLGILSKYIVSSLKYNLMHPATSFGISL